MGNNNKLINPNWAKHGYIQIYTGDGKGKTTASLGLAMRALGRNWKVLIVMFTKGGNDYGELNSFRELSPKISDNLKIIQAGLDRIVYINNETEEGDVEQTEFLYENGITDYLKELSGETSITNPIYFEPYTDGGNVNEKQAENI